MKRIIKLAYNHLSNDMVMSYLIDKFGDKINWGNRYNSNYALSIANLIIEQQISFKAAITVKKRFAKILDKKSEWCILYRLFYNSYTSRCIYIIDFLSVHRKIFAINKKYRVYNFNNFTKAFI